ncbi:MAG TPA: TlpA disulfide reductase family protein [Bryobacteraceae bacterium]|nr:TlpA disulfide reductase family protein [Bryobacteraceae bacterium]
MRLSLIVPMAAAVLALAPLASAVNLPRPTPEFAVQMPGGKQILLSSFRGKVVLVQFLYTTCPHCQATSQMLTKLSNEYSSRGVQVVGVAFNEMAGMLVPDYVKDYHVAFPVGFSPRDPVLAYLGLSPMERFVVPQIVLIDKKGDIRFQSPPLGDERLQDETYLRQQIEMLLKEKGGVHHMASATKRP